MKSIALFCLILFYDISLLLAGQELVTTIIVTYMGASAPPCGFIHPSYNIDMTKWRNGLINLTDTGIQDDFVKGQLLRERYTHLYGGGQAPATEIIVNGDYKTTLSALATYKGFVGENITGHLQEVKDQIVDSQHFPSITKNPDLFLDALDRCSSFIPILVRACINSQAYNEFVRNKSALMDLLKNVSGIGAGWNSFYLAGITHTLMADHYHNNPLPELVTPDVLEEIKTAFTHLTPKFCNVSKEYYQKVVGLFNKDMVEKINLHTTGNGTADHKVYIYPALYYTLSVLFDQYNISQKYVNFSSELVFEIWKEGNEMDVKFYYKDGLNGEYVEVRHSKKLSSFLKKTNRYKVDDVEQIRQACAVTVERRGVINHSQAVNC